MTPRTELNPSNVAKTFEAQDPRTPAQSLAPKNEVDLEPCEEHGKVEDNPAPNACAADKPNPWLGPVCLAY